MRDVANWLLARRWMIHHTVTRAPRGCAPDSRLRGAAGQPVQKEVVVWKNLGEWSGRGNAQTESFVGLTGALRMHWRTNNETPKGTGNVPADSSERHQRT